MEERTKQDRIRGSLYMVKSLKAQINALMISMNNDYLTLLNITLFEEVIYKFLDPTSSQFVVVALVRAGMVLAKIRVWKDFILARDSGLIPVGAALCRSTSSKIVPESGKFLKTGSENNPETKAKKGKSLQARSY